MESLIRKAIEAINDNKTERAIGLLEGALEMSEPKSSWLPKLKSIDTPENREKIQKGYDAVFAPTANDEGDMLDRQAKAQLESVKRLASQGIQ